MLFWPVFSCSSCHLSPLNRPPNWAKMGPTPIFNNPISAHATCTWLLGFLFGSSFSNLLKEYIYIYIYNTFSKIKNNLFFLIKKWVSSKPHIRITILPLLDYSSALGLYTTIYFFKKSNLFLKYKNSQFKSSCTSSHLLLLLFFNP